MTDPSGTAFRTVIDRLAKANEQLRLAAEHIRQLTKAQTDAQEAARAQARAEASERDRVYRAEAALSEATKALRFYADRKNWRHGQPFGGILGRLTPIEADAGRVARDALALEPVVKMNAELAVLKWISRDPSAPLLVTKKKDAE